MVILANTSDTEAETGSLVIAFFCAVFLVPVLFPILFLFFFPLVLLAHGLILRSGLCHPVVLSRDDRRAIKRGQ